MWIHVYGLHVTFTASQTGETFYPPFVAVMEVYLIFFRKRHFNQNNSCHKM